MAPTDPAAGHPRRHATVLESVEEIRALARGPSTVRESAPPTHAIPSHSPAAGPAPAEPFRPVERPPMAVLTVLDDGEETGEQVRLRGPVFVIGRVDGDLIIPHDGGISGRHAEISRRLEGGRYRWYLRDLQSTNGTFARASQVVLGHGQEVLIGRARFRFEAAAPAPAPAPSAAATRKWQAPDPHSPPALPPRASLVELARDGDGRRLTLDAPEVWVGRDPAACAIVLDDPTADPRHARLARDPAGRWVLSNAGSRNGVWARIDEVPLGRGGQFLCGEQRFLVRIL